MPGGKRYPGRQRWRGGDVLLWQHLFWFFGHPEVYIIFLPAVGMISPILPTFAQRPIFGYLPLVLALIATGILAFGLWVHHMFATGLPRLGESFFTTSSMAIAIPNGVQIFCWLATLALGRPVLRTPMLFVLAFFFTFIIGGLSGVMVASVPLDTQVHDTYLVVAHVHYVLIGAVFPLLGAIYYWFPKFTGRMMSERLGCWVCGLVFGGFKLTFFPMHILGLQGMPRRIYTYQAGMQWGGLNLFVSLSACVLAAGFLLFFIDVLRSLRIGTPAGSNPWNAATLEWATSSPPRSYNFARIPIVSGANPLWDESELPVASGLRVERRELVISAWPQRSPRRVMLRRPIQSGHSLPPLPPTVMLISSIFSPWAVVWGSLPVMVTLIGWFWPKSTPEDLA